MPFRIINICAWCLVFLTSCNAQKKEKKPVVSPPGYAFDQSTDIKLDEDLDEISGIVYSDSMKTLIGLNDEQGRLYIIPPDGKAPYTDSKFDKGADYEDLCYDGRYFYALKSKGTIMRVLYPFTDSTRTEAFSMQGEGKNDFETLVMDPKAGRLVMICKTCPANGQEVLGYAFYPDSLRFSIEPAFRLDLSGLADTSLLPKDIIKPSAGAIHPITGDWYIIASANRRLLITDASGKCKAMYKLNEKIFKQPEGICFKPNGDLYISNEAGQGIANLRFFPYQAPKQ